MQCLHFSASLHGCAMLLTSDTRLAGASSYLWLPPPWSLTHRARLPPSFPHLLQRKFTGSFLCKASGAREVDADKVLLKKRGSELVDDLRGTCIYLVGMNGIGKSAIGQTLAEALGYFFFDSDKLIEEAAGGTTVSQLIEEEDEDSFRDAETEVLKQLSCMGRLVVATGGGMVLRPMNWSYLRHGITVWLDVPVDALVKRVVEAGVESRPLLGLATNDSVQSEALERLSSILKVRGPFYANSDATVSLQKMASEMRLMDANSLTPAMVALEVLEEINNLIVKRKK